MIGPYLDMTLEPFEVGFVRDMRPEGEVALRCGITAAWRACYEKHLGDEALPDDQERNLFGAPVAIPTGVEDVAKPNVPEEVGRWLLRLR